MKKITPNDLTEHNSRGRSRATRLRPLVNKRVPNNPSEASQLEQLPNIGSVMAADLRLLGISHPEQLTGKDAFDLYDQLNRTTGQRHDPCVIDVFLSAIHFMETGETLTWWSFTAERKARLQSD